jgi:hypothetical protein
MLTGIGGGMARDVLLAEIPTVLRSELYNVAALAGAAGAAVVVIGAVLELPSIATTIAGAVLCFGAPIHGYAPRLAPSGRRRTRATNHAGAYAKRSLIPKRPCGGVTCS